MDIRIIFKAISEQLIAEFQKTSQVKHPGGKGDIREDAFRSFLIDYLPKRYSVGRGEVFTPENRVSPELDIVIYDSQHCPTLLSSPSHSIYPVESVYGAISIKSKLSSGNLQEAYRNIRSFKSIIPTGGFAHSPSPGFSIGVSVPVPITGVVAYDSDRSLDAIASQLESLDTQFAELQFRPDFVAVIGKGIIGPRGPLRGDFNNFQLPSGSKALVELRKTGRHTLLRLYLQVLRELNALTLRPLDLGFYDQKPRLVGPYRVSGKSQFVKVKLDGSEEPRTCQLNEAAIKQVVTNSQRMEFREYLLKMFGEIPIGAENFKLDEVVYEYNSRKISLSNIGNSMPGQNGSAELSPALPVPVNIDEKIYYVDLGALDENHFDDEIDLTVDELLSG